MAVASLLPWLEALDDLLTGDATLLALLNDGVNSISDLPQKQGRGYPYIVTGDISASNNDNKSKDGWTVTGIIHCWSDYQGSTQLLQILERCYVLLHHNCLTVTNNDNWLVFCSGFDNFIEPNGVTRHGVLRYTAQIQEA